MNRASRRGIGSGERAARCFLCRDRLQHLGRPVALRGALPPGCDLRCSACAILAERAVATEAPDIVSFEWFLDRCEALGDLPIGSEAWLMNKRRAWSRMLTAMRNEEVCVAKGVSP